MFEYDIIYGAMSITLKLTFDGLECIKELRLGTFWKVDAMNMYVNAGSTARLKLNCVSMDFFFRNF